MPVDRPDVIKAELLEQRPAGDPAAGIFLDLPRPVVDRVRHRPRDPLRDLARGEIFVRADQPRERVAQAPDRRRDRHVVVVEDDDQPVAGRGGIVHRLVGHAGRQRAVADDRDCPARLFAKLVGDGETQRGRDRGRAVGRAERIVLALHPPGETAQARALAKGADALAPSGQDLVRIGLVPDVPDQFVAGRVEHIVERDRQLDDPQPRAEMPAGHRHRRDHLLAKLVGQLRQLVLAERAQVGGQAHRVEKRGIGAV